jgi:oxygen-dependent protoporphyrinogen oxidase
LLSVNKRHVVIVGGGITGLSAAFYLMKQAEQRHLPLSISVLEADKQFGGKIRTHRESGFVLEGGPDSIIARKTHGVQLMKDLGVESEMVNTNAKAYKSYILHKGKLERLPPGTNMGIPAQFAPFATTKLLSFGGKLRALGDLMIGRHPEPGDKSLGSFLRRRFGDELVNHIVEPLLAGVYAGSVDDLSLEATFPQFAQLERKHRSLILGSIKARRKQPTVNNSGRSAFVTLRSGLQTLIERLHDVLKDTVTLRTEARVHRVKRSAHGRYEVVFQEQGGPEQSLQCDAVLVTTPAFAAAEILQDVIDDVNALRDIPYVSTATVILAFRREEVNLDLDASGFVIPRNEQRKITACTWVSTKWPHTTPEDYVLIRCYVGRSGDQEGLKLSDDEMVEIVRGELRDILSITARPVFTKVTRWYHAMPQYLVNHLRRVEHVERALETDAPGVYIAGAGYRGLGIPDCIMQAQAAVEKIMGHLMH